MDPQTIAVITATVTVIGMVGGGVSWLYRIFLRDKTIPELLKEIREKRMPKSKNKKEAAEDIPPGETTGIMHTRPPYLSKAYPHLQDLAGEIKRLVETSKYVEAVRMGEKIRQMIEESGIPQDAKNQLYIGQLNVYYSHALIYTGQTEQALRILGEIIRELDTKESTYADDTIKRNLWHVVVGRAHNHIGYANWMDLRHYSVAIREFQQSIKLFLAADIKEELSTAYDNLGRVYGELGDRARAEFLIELGRKIRWDTKDYYRHALSLNSSAIIQLTFGNPFKALLLSTEAKEIFDKHVDERGARGKGLALLTMGEAQRNLGSQSYQKYNLHVLEKIKYLEEARSTLEEAAEIFDEDRIDEDVRRFHAINQLGCTFREMSQVALSQGKRADGLQHASLAVEWLNKSIRIAEGKYPSLCADACEDLAQTYILVGDNTKAKELLDKAENAIPKTYQYKRSSNTSLPTDPDEWVYEYWQQLGKIEVSRGICKSISTKPATAIIDSLRHYVLACGYFGNFLGHGGKTRIELPERIRSPQLKSHQLFLTMLYDQLGNLSVEDLRQVKGNLFQLAIDYGIDPKWIDVFFGDILEFFMEINAHK